MNSIPKENRLYRGSYDNSSTPTAQIKGRETAIAFAQALESGSGKKIVGLWSLKNFKKSYRAAK